MSRTKPVGFGAGAKFWAYDAALAILLAQVIDNVAALPTTQRPSWWSQYEEELRIQATVSDLYFDLAACPDREEFAVLLEQASGQLLNREAVTAEEAAAWTVLGDSAVIFRGPLETAPVAELGRALVGLLRGGLAEAPGGSWWFYGAPGGRSTIARRVSGD
ncbi:MAG: hypothetical protein QOH03_4111 [Kribbellaceae bacterium]|jgi:hypothetical protein|nr:hypothetical protein [Kribbellaceae bacterium]